MRICTTETVDVDVEVTIGVEHIQSALGAAIDEAKDTESRHVVGNVVTSAYQVLRAITPAHMRLLSQSARESVITALEAEARRWRNLEEASQ